MNQSFMQYFVLLKLMVSGRINHMFTSYLSKAYYRKQ